MRRTRSPNRPAVSRGATRLIHLAIEWSEASSLLEDRFWEREVIPEIDGLLESGNEKTITTALESLWSRDPVAHDLVADLIESRAECMVAKFKGEVCDMILIALPVLAWSRDKIPCGKLSAAATKAIAAQLQGHVLAKAAHVTLAPAIFSPDQLPHQYTDSFTLARSMFTAMQEGKAFPIDFSNWPETGQFIADTRLVIAGVAVPAGGAIFRWQEEEISRDKVLTNWREQGGAVLQAAMPGCTIEPLMPSAFHDGSRLADSEGRGFSLKAGVQFLEAVSNLAPKDMVAVVAPFYERELEEYRISLMREGREDVLHGVVWPVLGTEAEEGTVADEIEALLKTLGVANVIQIDHKFPLEHCSDCGAPMFSDPDAELVHAGFPEDDVPETVRYH
jgi:hypothetical protein